MEMFLLAITSVFIHEIQWEELLAKEAAVNHLAKNIVALMMFYVDVLLMLLMYLVS